MLVRDYMSAKVISAERECSISDVRTLLRKHRIRQVPVVHDDRLVGIVTDRDVRSATAQAKTVADIMTTKPSSTGPNAPIDEAARLLRALKIGGLPVMENHRVVGMLTTSDVMDAFVEFCGVTEPTYHLVLTGGDGADAKWRVRRVIDRQHGDLKWIYRDRRSGSITLRVRATNIDDITAALEAQGFDVTTIVSPNRSRGSKRGGRGRRESS